MTTQNTHKQSPEPVTKKQTKVASPALLFFGACVIALVGFVVGTRAEQLQAYIGPVLGIHKSAQTIDLSSLQNTYQYLKANFDGKLDDQKLIDGANHGLVSAAGDKYTTYFNKQEAASFSKDLSGDVGAGIGAEIGDRGGQPTIVQILPDNPAQSAGMLEGDVITAVNGESSVGWTSDKTASKVRGEVGTSVKITIIRGGLSKDFSITRATINNPSVTSKIKNNIGIMTISRFDDKTSALARQAAENFKRLQVKGVVLDLRSDGGGYLDAAVDVAGLWLDDKLVVTQRKGATVIDSKRSGSDTVLAGIKTVVLVNGGSASASEILAGALRDNGIAELVGDTTFGKGSVQEVIQLGQFDALLKVTVAKWYTPKGVNINDKGFEPDVTVKITRQEISAGQDPQLARAEQLVQ